MIYNEFKKNLLKEYLNGNTIKIMLVTSAYSQNIDDHNFKSDVSGEVTGTGYVAGGKTLQNLTFVEDKAGDKGYFDADDVVWLNSTITARGAIIYKDTGNASTSELIDYIDFTEDKPTVNTDFKITFASGGLISVT